MKDVTVQQEARPSIDLVIRIVHASREKDRVGLRVALVVKPEHTGMASSGENQSRRGEDGEFMERYKRVENYRSFTA